MMNKPKIRFNGFKDDWDQRKLGDIADGFEYGLNAAATEFDGENKYIRITDIDDETRLFLQESVTSPDINLEAADNYILREGDILFARTGASVGKTYIYKGSDGLMYYAGFLIKAHVNKQNNANFVFQNTLTESYKKYIQVTSQRSGQPGVNAKEYQEFTFCVPNKLEQDKISSYLMNLDNLITLHQRKCDETKKLKKYMLQNMFPEDGKKTPNIRFDGFTDDWEQRKLGDMARFSKGNGYSKSDLRDQGTPIILYGRLYTQYEFAITVVDTFVSEKPGSVISNGGEVIIPASGETAEDIARAATVENKGIILGGDLNIVHPGEELISQFLSLVISNGTVQKELASKAQGKSVVHIHNSDIEKVTVNFPNLAEQKKIVQTFKELDNLITLHQRKCDQLKKIKKFMLENMFV